MKILALSPCYQMILKFEIVLIIVTGIQLLFSFVPYLTSLHLIPVLDCLIFVK